MEATSVSLSLSLSSVQSALLETDLAFLFLSLSLSLSRCRRRRLQTVSTSTRRSTCHRGITDDSKHSSTTVQFASVTMRPPGFRFCGPTNKRQKTVVVVFFCPMMMMLIRLYYSTVSQVSTCLCGLSTILRRGEHPSGSLNSSHQNRKRKVPVAHTMPGVDNLQCLCRTSPLTPGW